MELPPVNSWGDARGGHRGGIRGSSGERGRGRGEHRGRGRGRGRGHEHGQEPSARQNNTADSDAKRPGSIHFSTDGTDRIITAPVNASKYRQIASVILRHEVEIFPKQDEQVHIRNFVASCLLNLSDQNGMDTSGIFDLLSSEAGCACLGRILTRPMSVDAGYRGPRLSFQYVVLPLIGTLTRESVCQSVMASSSSRLYSTVYAHRKAFLEEGVLRCMDQLLERGSILDGSLYGAQMTADTSICQVPSVQGALLVISRLVYQLVTRIEDAKFELENTIGRLSAQRKACIPKEGVDSAESCFLGNVLEKEIGRLVTIVSYARTTIIEPNLEPEHEANEPRPLKVRGPNMAHLERQYDPPGHLSRGGQRHDNDHLEISSISIVPTFEELTSTREPFIPSNCIPEAPHFLPHGWKRQLDIHFRLYREDLVGHLRSGLMAFLDELSETQKGKEDGLLKKRVYKGRNDNFNVDVYGGLQFHSVDCKKHAQHSAVVTFTQPFEIGKRDVEKCRDFWVRSKKRLMVGALVFMVTRSDNKGVKSTFSRDDVILGVVADRDIEELSKYEDHARIRISLVDPKLYLTMIDATNPFKGNKKPGQWFLVEPSVGYYEFYRPVLEVLKAQLASTMPFGKYLAPTKEEMEVIVSNGVKIDPPQYARAPGFRFDLSVLTKGQHVELDVASTASIEMSVKALQEGGSLDATQSSALVEALCREVALISGPPGTGKTRIGVELMQVLLHNKRSISEGPILCICYTNHALDQFLEHLVDKGVTSIIRVGSRKMSERMAEFSLEDHVYDYDKPLHLRKKIRQSCDISEKVSESISELQKALRNDYLPWAHVDRYLQENRPGQWMQFLEQPPSDLDKKDPFTVAPNKSPRKEQRGRLFYRWLRGADIEEMKAWNEEMLESKDTPWMEKSLNPYALLDEDDEWDDEDDDLYMYEIPDTDRPLELLNGDVWEMSMSERERLLDMWRPRIRESMMQELAKALEESMDIIKMKNNCYDEVRRDILRKTTVIGITTSGAAKHQELIKAVAPEIIICEEAGEVIESHILATLSSSTQHLIMIGDHLQLRPQIQTYNLSSDSTIGRHHNLDISLFERLITAKTNPLPSSQLTIQRRMRPEISSLIRNTLYPYLEDGQNVNYPNVNGMGSNLYFMDHSHPVDSKDQCGPQSFSNTFEVKMVETLVHYLMMNGYHHSGDIAVLTPYLGQLSKLRACLSGTFTLVMNELDQDQLDMQDAEKDDVANMKESAAAPMPVVVNVPLKSRLTLQTIDNYQGEEAKVVIISLVRSDVREDGLADSFASIGFLKSSNRTNVLLSRAQHGMYLIGNANLMERRAHGIWKQVVTQLRESGRVGDGFPIVCKKHPDVTNIVTRPEMLCEISPHGGCNRPCGYNLPCGHVCPLKCHPGDLEHAITKCLESCMRLHSVCDHVCPKRCGETCGDCMMDVDPIVLECGHVLERPKCYQAKDPSKAYCKVEITKKQSSCEHEYVIECGKSDTTVPCDKPCGSLLDCGHICKRSCVACKKSANESEAISTETIPNTPGDLSFFGREKHGTLSVSEVRKHGRCQTTCKAVQPCGHTCGQGCHVGKPCPPCTQPCSRRCYHTQCRKACKDPCDICLQLCTWECPHQGKCKMECGLLCDRPPCDRRCEKTLYCGHQCPSVCGERCPKQKYCVECKNADTMDLIVSVQPYVILLRDLDVNHNPVLDLECGHAIAMSVLDREAKKATNSAKLEPQKESQSDFVHCPWCQRQITHLMRYRHGVMHSRRWDQQIKEEQVVIAKRMSEVRDHFDNHLRGLEKKKVQFLALLSDTEAPRPNDPPNCQIRRLGKPDKKFSPFPQSDVKSISRIYGIPLRHERAWKTLIEPLTGSMQQFAIVFKRASIAATRNNSDAKAATTPQLPLLPSKVDPTKKGTLKESELRTGGGSSSEFDLILVDLIQERVYALFTIVSLAFAALDVAGSLSGWYWLIEDLINCTTSHVQMVEDIVSRGQCNDRIMDLRLMRFDLVCKRALWNGARPKPTDGASIIARSRLLENLQQEALAEHARCSDGIMLPQERASVDRLEKKMAKAFEIANRWSLFEPISWGEEGTSVYQPSRKERQAEKK